MVVLEADLSMLVGGWGRAEGAAPENKRNT